MRLQLEIIKRSDDESIFAWASDQYFAGMLAPSPSYFAASEDVRKYLRGVEQRPPYAMTNKGLDFHIPDPRLPGGEVALHCSRTIGEEDVAVTITLYKHNDTWQRMPCKLGRRKIFVRVGTKTKAIYVRQDGI